LVAALAARAKADGWVPVAIRAAGVHSEPEPQQLTQLVGSPGDEDVWALLQARWRLVGVLWAGGDAGGIEDLLTAARYLWRWLTACRPEVPWVGGVADMAVGQSWMARALAATPAASERRWAVVGHPTSTGLVVPVSLLEQFGEGRERSVEVMSVDQDAYAHVDDVAAAYWTCLHHLLQGGASGHAAVGLRPPRPAPATPVDGETPRTASPGRRRQDLPTIPVPPSRSWEDLLAAVRGRPAHDDTKQHPGQGGLPSD
jgi:hypothetical protein